MKRIAHFLLLAFPLLYSCSKPYNVKTEPLRTTQQSERIYTLTDNEKDNTGAFPDKAYPFPKDFEERVAEIVKPAQEALRAVLNEDETGTYKAYLVDIQKISERRSIEEWSKALSLIKEKYYAFIKEAWEKAAIDEKEYQVKILNALPDSLREDIEFEPEFLGFTMKGHTRKPEPEPAPPAPSLKCVDARATIFDIPKTDKGLAATAAAMLDQGRFLFTTAASFPPGGGSFGRNDAGTDVTIPGTFPQDDNLVRIKKEFDWLGGAMAISGGWLSVSETAYASRWWEWDHFVKVVAPVIWYVNYTANRQLSSEELVEKRFLLNIRYGFSCYSAARTLPIAGATASSDVSIKKWEICEEKPQ
ncbi:hypothetical protein LL912_02185 [Niabella sp. CC-SYL272]|uniref:hypothetical protein n=1 Tax=Niabella agricola TaxID=2891571 RepID=UPI001F41B809|nr:hypothetical protein [Niabella agricola]MCF3107578.1 hypothetical protein [Niabella agricola]